MIIHQPLTKFTLRGLSVWAICALFFAYEFLLRTLLGTFQAPLMRDLKLTSVSFACLSTTIYFIAYAIMQMPAGMIAEKWGLKKTLTVAVALCALSGTAFAFVQNQEAAFFARLLMGLGSGFGFVCLMVSVYDWIPKAYYGLFIGLSQFIGTLGPMIAAGPINDLAIRYHLDWRMVFLGFGCLGFLLLIAVIGIVRSNANEERLFRIVRRPRAWHVDLFELFKQKQTWCIALYSALVYCVVEYLSENEGKAFIELRGLNPIVSSYMITLAWVGYAMSCPLLGALSDYIKRRKLIMVFSALGSCLAAVLIIYFPASPLLLGFSFYLLGVGAGGQSIGLAMMAEYCHKTYVAVAFGFNNAMITVISSVNAPLIGWLIEHHRIGETLTVSDYQFGFSVILLLLTAAFSLALLAVRETFCRPRQGFTYLLSERS